MIKRIVTILLIAVTTISAMNAATVSENEARAIAGRFFNTIMPATPTLGGLQMLKKELLNLAQINNCPTTTNGNNVTFQGNYATNMQ